MACVEARLDSTFVYYYFAKLNAFFFSFSTIESYCRCPYNAHIWRIRRVIKISMTMMRQKEMRALLRLRLRLRLKPKTSDFKDVVFQS